jgi:flagellar biosynthetic protein FlhB
MAEDQGDRSSDDLTEEASPHRLEEMREKGQVAQSRELAGLLALIAVGSATYLMAPEMGKVMAEYMREVFSADYTSRLNLGDSKVLASTFEKAFYLLVMIGLPVSFAGFVIGIVGSIAQIGSVFSLEPITPDFERINPLKGIQKLVTMRQVIESLRVVIKMIVVVWVAYSITRGIVAQTPGLLNLEVPSLLGLYGVFSKDMFSSLMGVLLVFAVLDFFHQRFEFNKSAKMTKQEAKQEFKEREGDPQIKARVRAIQREISRRRMMEAVKKADVIVTNPTHIAVAIVYDKDKMLAPKVVAKGADFLAQKIKKIASDAGVPLVENVGLARTLFKSVKIGHYVPRALYQTIAEVLAYVYRLKNRRF